MSSTRRSGIASCNIGEIIDIIDLTDETYYNESQSYNDVSENYPSLNNSSPSQSHNLRLNQEQTTTLVSTVLDTLAAAISITTTRNTNRRRNRNDNRRQTIASNRNRTNANASIIEEPEEIYLDDTITSKTNGPWCINDSCLVEPTTLTCAICLEELNTKCKPTTTSCGHIFCENCLIKVIHETKKCPTCQSKISKKSCTRLYF